MVGEGEGVGVSVGPLGVGVSVSTGGSVASPLTAFVSSAATVPAAWVASGLGVGPADEKLQARGPSTSRAINGKK